MSDILRFEHFPRTRMRRLRQNPAVRAMVREARVEAANLILPLFVRADGDAPAAISSMPGQFQLPLSALGAEIDRAAEAGVGGVLLFGIPKSKDKLGADSYDDKGIVQRALKEVKARAPHLLTITDVCLCEYTDHGHCGIVKEIGGRVDVENDATLELLAKQAVSHAKAGADIVAPSGMMDGMVGAIRSALNGAGYSHLPIMSYAVKFASAFYGPFREAAESAPQFGDRRGYQMDPASSFGVAAREVSLDLNEGADIIMVKPALAYLDILSGVRDKFPGVPLAAYNVSGEYSMVKAAAEKGWLDERTTVLEMFTAFRRAGANIIISYWARDAAGWLS